MKRMNWSQKTIPQLAEANLSFDQANILARTIPTPFLALSAERLKAKFQILKKELPGVELYYAMKSNSNPRILELVSIFGDGVDVASVNEVKRAKAAGIRADRLLHSHPIKSTRDIENCVKEGVSWFTFDNEDELSKLKKFAPHCNVLLRLVVLQNSSVVNLSLKFGAEEHNALPLIQKAIAAGLQVRGLAFHVGSQCRNPDNYRAALLACKRIFDAAQRKGIKLDVLDIGGGFPIGYRADVPPLSQFCFGVSDSLKTLFPTDVRVIAEPGRCICGDAITLVVSVIGKAVRRGVYWYFIDDGVYGSFSGKFFDLCDYRLLVDKSGPYTECVVAGPTCDSIDVISKDQPLPKLEIGDLLLVPGMGAYTCASATFFNGFSPARTLVIEEMNEIGLMHLRSSTANGRRSKKNLAVCAVKG
jgi:ornithine decarboxylase